MAIIFHAKLGVLILDPLTGTKSAKVCLTLKIASQSATEPVGWYDQKKKKKKNNCLVPSEDLFIMLSSGSGQ